MATIEEAIVTILEAEAGLSALVGAGSAARIYPLRVPQDVALPALAYQKISSPKTNSHSGPSHLANSRIQFTVQAKTYASAKATAAALREALGGYRGTAAGVRIDGVLVQDERDSWSEQHAAPVVRLDVMVWHYE